MFFKLVSSCSCFFLSPSPFPLALLKMLKTLKNMSRCYLHFSSLWCLCHPHILQVHERKNYIHPPPQQLYACMDHTTHDHHHLGYEKSMYPFLSWCYFVNWRHKYLPHQVWANDLTQLLLILMQKEWSIVLGTCHMTPYIIPKIYLQ